MYGRESYASVYRIVEEGEKIDNRLCADRVERNAGVSGAYRRGSRKALCLWRRPRAKGRERSRAMRLRRKGASRLVAALVGSAALLLGGIQILFIRFWPPELGRI